MAVRRLPCIRIDGGGQPVPTGRAVYCIDYNGPEPELDARRSQRCAAMVGCDLQPQYFLPEGVDDPLEDYPIVRCRSIGQTRPKPNDGFVWFKANALVVDLPPPGLPDFPPDNLLAWIDDYNLTSHMLDIGVFQGGRPPRVSMRYNEIGAQTAANYYTYQTRFLRFDNVLPEVLPPPNLADISQITPAGSYNPLVLPCGMFKVPPSSEEMQLCWEELFPFLTVYGVNILPRFRTGETFDSNWCYRVTDLLAVDDGNLASMAFPSIPLRSAGGYQIGNANGEFSIGAQLDTASALPGNWDTRGTDTVFINDMPSFSGFVRLNGMQGRTLRFKVRARYQRANVKQFRWGVGQFGLPNLIDAPTLQASFRFTLAVQDAAGIGAPTLGTEYLRQPGYAPPPQGFSVGVPGPLNVELFDVDITIPNHQNCVVWGAASQYGQCQYWNYTLVGIEDIS